MASKRIVTVCGWSGCSYYARAKEMAKTLAVLYPADYEANLEEEATRDDYRAKLDVFRSKTPSDAKAPNRAVTKTAWVPPGCSFFVR